MVLNYENVFIIILLLFACQISCQKYSCPPPTAVQICEETCNSDDECTGEYQCCPTGCGGTYCVQPVTFRRNVNVVKPGSCPSVPKGPWVCSNRCTFDSDCKGRAKCCENVCGALACTLPKQL